MWSIALLKLCNNLMLGGKKFLAVRILASTFFLVRKTVGKGIISAVIFNCMRTIRPIVSFKYRPFGNRKYPIPLSLYTRTSYSLAAKWLVAEARKHKHNSISRNLAFEILESLRGSSNSIRRRNKLYRIVLLSRAYARFK